MSRILIVSNRLPVSIETEPEGFSMEPSVGGLATGLRSFYKDYQSSWIGWPGIPSEVSRGLDGLEDALLEENCIPVEMPQELLDGYYYGFANRTVWPLFHYFQQYTEYSWRLWKAYRKANQKFAEEVLKVAGPGDRIWIHDYHLMLLPGMLKEKLPNSSIGFFLHIPFPSFELFRLLPWRDEIMEGILGSDLVGFHSYDYARHFLSSVLRLKGYDQNLNYVTVSGRQVCVDVFPIGIDYQKFSGAQETPEVLEHTEKLEEKLQGRKMILSVDRLDYTKGILHRLRAFELFIRENPLMVDKVRLALLVVPSRIKVPQYRNLKTELDEMVGRINSEYGDVSGGPIAYMFDSLPFPELAALYGKADVGLVTPIRDGMNLVAKEYVASQQKDHGMLVLSEMAGAAMELSESIVVNPNNTPEVADGILKALTMDPEKKKIRMRKMQKRVRRYDVIRWAEDFVGRLDDMKENQEREVSNLITESEKSQLIEKWEKAGSRLILLNYDGTLVPSGRDLQQIRPDPELSALLNGLADTPGNRLVIFSGRHRDSLEDLFDGGHYDLVAEGGFWIREPGRRWRMLLPFHGNWKREIMPVMKFYEDRTPGAFIEEKDFSLVFHYRRTEPDLAEVRSRELLLALYAQTASMDLDVIKGRKLIEIRNAEINKGRAVQHWLEKKRWDLILAAGDGASDESVFNALPDRAYTFRIGGGNTEARFRLKSEENMREFLRELCHQ
ncbi:MAG: bifunctional alpha,alpha-trehalose-phosphate synthase (UDP-forming)/trehalose-phosphatase [Candidatus Aegiribacteria sp.]|nr:bifunctional alpha,alpha-trehalose-phosphate synthase (UDP-forming)/trehalose-phosphatase [Candidatus Aegiribacteria sp.]MBD3293953.1 bifunctional alpha,alpha-trehalose-phosphate synthase (UDP-forming)/trehalose-phosphatase [Candidatus Fermentibacteria bacterium]